MGVINPDFKHYDKLSYIGKLEYWLYRLYENKYEADKLYLDFHHPQLKELMKDVRRGHEDENVEK